LRITDLSRSLCSHPSKPIAFLASIEADHFAVRLRVAASSGSVLQPLICILAVEETHKNWAQKYADLTRNIACMVEE